MHVDRTIELLHVFTSDCLHQLIARLHTARAFGKHAQRDDYTMRQVALRHNIPYTTTLSAASAASDAILSLRNRVPGVRSLQEWQGLLEPVVR